MRLFTALWPPAAAVDHLAARLPDRWPAGVRPTPASRWHLTLCFHGDDADPEACAERLGGLAGSVAPTLRLAGSGSFPGVLWVGVRPRDAADARALTVLAAAAGADPDAFRAHVTVARWRRGMAPPAAVLTGYRGPEWIADEVALVASETGAGGPRYQTLHRIHLGRIRRE
jgi:2'-5' RNA ligase